MKHKLLLLLLLVFLQLVFPGGVHAVNISIDSFPQTISSLDQFQVVVSVTGATNATNYLRIDLYKDGSTNYFGETYNGSTWYNASDGKNYFPIQIQDASASATFSGRLGGPNTNEYFGPGAYKLKIRRYTASGSSASGDEQIPVDVQITYNFPTSTPISSPTTAPTATPVKTATPTVTAVKTATPKPNMTATPDVLGESDNQTDVPSPTEEPLPETTTNTNSGSKKGTVVVAMIFVGLGIIVMGLAVFMVYIKSKSPHP